MFRLGRVVDHRVGFRMRFLQSTGKQLLHRREVIRGIQHILRINHILNDIQIGVVYCAFAGIAFTTFKNRHVQHQTTCIVICRMTQPQFIDSLLSGNPVFIAVTLNLNYLLFRYFQPTSPHQHITRLCFLVPRHP